MTEETAQAEIVSQVKRLAAFVAVALAILGAPLASERYAAMSGSASQAASSLSEQKAAASGMQRIDMAWELEASRSVQRSVPAKPGVQQEAKPGQVVIAAN